MKKEKGLGKAHVKICSLQKGRNITSKKAKKKWKQQKEIRKYATFCWFALSFLHLLCRVSVSFSDLLFGVSFFTVFQKDETATITLTVSWIVCTILERPDISQVVWKVKNVCGWSSSHVKELNLFKPRSKTFLTTLCQPLNTSLLFKTSSVVVTSDFDTPYTTFPSRSASIYPASQNAIILPCFLASLWKIATPPVPVHQEAPSPEFRWLLCRPVLAFPSVCDLWPMSTP